MSLTACAKALSDNADFISRQGLGKYCKNHELIRGKGRGAGSPSLVSFAEVSNHREKNYTREVMSGEASGARVKTAQNEKPTLTAVNTNLSNPAPAELDDARRLKKVQADRAELELEKDKGNVTPVHEVEAGIAEMFSALRTSGKAALTSWADRTTAELGLPADRVRQVRALGRALLREGEKAFHTEAVRLADQTRQNVHLSTARQRLETLAAVAHRERCRLVADANKKLGINA